MVPHFGRNPTKLCLIFNRIVDFIYEHHHHRLQSWDQFFLQPDQLHKYAQGVHHQGAPLSNCFGFIDGTVRGIARPQENERVMYNGHKQLHSIKFQSVVIPNGLIANLHGPIEGKRHDSTMLQETGVLRDLRRIAFHNGDPLCLYGDPAYPLGVHLQAPFRNMYLGLYNHVMSEVQVAVAVSVYTRLILLVCLGTPRFPGVLLHASFSWRVYTPRFLVFTHLVLHILILNIRFF